MQDTGHILFDAHGCGADRREELDEQIRMGVRSFRDVSEEMWGSLNVPFENGFEVMKEALKIDPHFLEFHDFCIKNNIPFNVISAGLKPILRRVLDEFLGKKQVCRSLCCICPLIFPADRCIASLNISISLPTTQSSPRTVNRGSPSGATRRHSVTTRPLRFRSTAPSPRPRAKTAPCPSLYLSETVFRILPPHVRPMSCLLGEVSGSKSTAGLARSRTSLSTRSGTFRRRSSGS